MYFVTVSYSQATVPLSSRNHYLHIFKLCLSNLFAGNIEASVTIKYQIIYNDLIQITYTGFFFKILKVFFK